MWTQTCTEGGKPGEDTGRGWSWAGQGEGPAAGIVIRSRVWVCLVCHLELEHPGKEVADQKLSLDPDP